MGKSKNKGKKQQSESEMEKSSDQQSVHSDNSAEDNKTDNKEKPKDKTDNLKEDSTNDEKEQSSGNLGANDEPTTSSPHVKSSPANKLGFGDDTQNGQPEDATKLPGEPHNIVDKTLAIMDHSKRLWTIMALLAAILAVLGHIDMGEEELVVEKGVALTDSRARVFRIVGDLATYGKWFPGVANFDAKDAMPMGVGKHFTEVNKVPLYGEIRYNHIVTSYESPRLVSFLSDSWLSERVEIELGRRESDITPTSVQYRVYATPKSLLSKYIALPAVRAMYNNRVRQGMFNLRYMFYKQ